MCDLDLLSSIALCLCSVYKVYQDNPLYAFVMIRLHIMSELEAVFIHFSKSIYLFLIVTAVGASFNLNALLFFKAGI